ncbi:MAG TPA: CDP-alcohol phosphatidyltransferase family protein [Candidatus Eisenbacteria bacterium]
MTATPAAAAERQKGGALAQIKERAKHLAHGAVAPIVGALAALGVRPDHLTWLGLALGIAAGFAFFDGHSRVGAALLAAGGLCDLLDGELARRRGAESPFGAFLDSTLDRLSEAAALAGLAGFGLRNLATLVAEPGRAVREREIGLYPEAWMALVLFAVLALVGSFMVSYTRARAEGLGLDCRVGWFERPERLVLLIAAGALQVFWAMPVALLLLAVLSFTTAAQRVAHVWRRTRGHHVERGPGRD